MTYEKYLDYSREELLEKVRAVMSPKRFNHVLGVERAAIALAEKYGYDTEKPAWLVCFMIMPRNFQIRNSWGLLINIILILN